MKPSRPTEKVQKDINKFLHKTGLGVSRGGKRDGRD
jgi:hypothetical protein